MTERLDAVDWASLFHAEGSAADTPRRLHGLLGSEEEMDAEAHIDGYSLLWRTLHPERKAWPATAPSAQLVAELVDDPRLGPDDPSLPRALLAYLQSFGMAADLGNDEPALRDRVNRRAPELRAWTKDYLAADADRRIQLWEEEPELGELVLDQARLACFDTVPVILDRVLPHLTTRDARHQAAAAGAVGALARHPSARARRPELAERMASMTADAESVYDLATIVIAIGLLDGDTRPWLADPCPGVRGSAALAPGLADDAQATEVLVQLSRAPRAFRASFGDWAPPHHFVMPPHRDLLTEALLARVHDPRVLIPAVVARLPLGASSSYGSLTPYLRAIFPNHGAERRVSAVQQRLAELIAELTADWTDWALLAEPEPLSQDDVVHSPEDIGVFEGVTGVRSRPEMFFGVGRTSPELPERVIGVLRAQFDHAADTGQVGSFRLDVDPASEGRRFTIDVRGHQFPSTPAGFNDVLARICPAWPLEYLSVAAALSSRVRVKEWSGDRCTTAEYVDGMALGQPRSLRAAPLRDGYEVTFDMDDSWWPVGDPWA